MGGINQSLFLIGALFVGQGAITGQGSAAVPLLIVGLLLSWAATPGWIELILMYPNRVGGIAGTCAEAFRPYSPVLANLTGVCYWWGWVPTCGLTALLSASAIHQWYAPWFPIPLMASCIVVTFTIINLCGVKWVMRVAMPVATVSAVMAFLSAVIPIFSGSVDWQQAFTFHLTVPFPGWFGQITSVMAGLYLIGFAAPAFEQAACHVGETIDPNRNVPRAMFASAGLASLYFIVLPVVWLGALGPAPLGQELALVLGPTFAPLLGGAAKAAAIWFMIFNMLHGTLAPLAGAARTLAQLAEDGLLPESLALRSRTDAPWVATVLTAVMAIAFLLIGDPIWLIAAANLTYLIGIAMPNVAVWLLRHNEPDMPRPYRAPHGTIMLGLFAAGAWALTAILGFQQFGLPTVLIGIAFAYSGSALYAWRKFSDRRKAGLPGIARTLHVKLTGAMLLVLVLDAVGYFIAVSQVPAGDTPLLAILEDIFVVVALLTIAVGLILPGMIAHSAVEVSKAATTLVGGTLADFTKAMRALAAGDLTAAKAQFTLLPVKVFSRDEVGDMAMNFNRLQEEIGRAADGLEGAREGLSHARADLVQTNEQLRLELAERKRAEQEREAMEIQLRQAQKLEAIGQLSGGIAHDFNNLLTVILGNAELLQLEAAEPERQKRLLQQIQHAGNRAASLTRQLLLFSRQQPPNRRDLDLNEIVAEMAKILHRIIGEHIQLELNYARSPVFVHADAGMLDQILLNLAVNARDAMRTGGQLTIRLEATTLTTGATPQCPHARPGEFSCLQVTDQGCGMTPEVMTRIFEPFFTTKDVGEGTGLGLATVYGIVLQHQGWIEVESQPNHGSTFRVFLPRVLHPTSYHVIQPPRDPPKGGGETILVVEDEPSVLNILYIALSRAGYEVIGSPSGVDALEIWPQHRNAVRLVLTDMVMPGGIGGAVLAKRLLADKPGLSVIFMSGYSIALDHDRLSWGAGAEFIAKPFSLDHVLQVVRERLDAANAALACML
jgi:signal transduction histidine kinase/CheY-like chemotaxis protein